MSTDARVTKDLMETLEDGQDGFAKGAEKLDGTDTPELAAVFRELGQQRSRMYGELQELAATYGDQIEESGSIVAAVHRGWMTLKDALAGDDPSGVLDAAVQGEDHAVKEYEKALDDADVSAGLRTVVERQLGEVRSARDRVQALRDARD